MKKAWNILYTAFTWILMVVAFVVMIFTIVSVTTVNRNERDIFGYKAYIVLSDSMSATDFDAGDLLIVRKVDPSELQAGDIISFQSRNSHNYGETVTHMIRQRTATENGLPGFITYGTTTGVDDEAIVSYSDVLGKYEFSIPKLGNFFQFLRTPKGYIVCILIPFLLLIGFQGLNCIRAFREYKDEELAQIRQEKEALLAERKKSEAMMENLMKMHAEILAQKSFEEKPKEPEHPDMDAILAELEQLRAQLKLKENNAEDHNA